MRLLITGAAGDVGSYLSRYLADRGHELVLLDRDPSVEALGRVYWLERRGNLQRRDPLRDLGEDGGDGRRTDGLAGRVPDSGAGGLAGPAIPFGPVGPLPG